MSIFCLGEERELLNTASAVSPGKRGLRTIVTTSQGRIKVSGARLNTVMGLYLSLPAHRRLPPLAIRGTTAG